MAEKLAEGQGGSLSAQAQEEGSRIGQFLTRGEEILQTFSQSIRAFEGQALQIKSLSDKVNELTSNKRKSESATPVTAEKKAKSVDLTSCHDEGNTDDEIDKIMNNDKNEDDSVSESGEDDFLQGLSSFFTEETETGEDIEEKVAKLVDRSLRGKPDLEKVKSLQGKYKRPGNIANLQVPKIDRGLWTQLKWQTKATDAVRQKNVQRLQEGLVPMILAMEHIATNNKPDVSLLKQYIGDTFKMMCNSIILTNTERRDIIKKELDPKYKDICETPSSATGLFGDSLEENLKKLDTKTIKVTSNATGKTPFLGKAGGRDTHRQYNL